MTAALIMAGVAGLVPLVLGSTALGFRADDLLPDSRVVLPILVGTNAKGSHG